MPGEKWGTVLSVQTANVGEYLTAAASSGATVLTVSDARTFDDTLGGQIQINGQSYVYTTVDEDANTITLFSGLLAAAAVDDLVEIVPPTPIRRALVSLVESEDEGVWANVPQSLVPLLNDGVRVTNEAESVLVEERASGELYVKDVAARAIRPDILTLPDLQAGHKAVVKAVDESRTNTATITSDTELKVYLTVGLWRVELVALATGATAADIRVAWVFTGTATAPSFRTAYGPAVATTDSNATTVRTTGFHALSSQVAYGIDAADSVFREDIVLAVDGEGTLTMQWAQNTASATPTIVSDGSRIYATRMSS